MFGAIIGSLAGAIAGGMGSYLTSVQHANAYKQAANDIERATNKYSGENANASMYNAGLNQASRENAASMRNAATTNAGSNNAMAEMNNRINNIMPSTNGYNTGANNRAKLNAANFNKDTQYAQNAMKQADIQNAVNGQMLQGAASGTQSLINTYKDISDKDMKEGINNDSGLPQANIQDVLRQLETIIYKYKDPNYPGCDNEEHCGFTAQSLEKAGNPNNAVSENEDGIKQVDRWRLMETITAGLAELQREIDNMNSSTSDELCKTPPLTANSIFEETYNKYNSMPNETIEREFGKLLPTGYKYNNADALLYDQKHRGMPYKLAENELKNDATYNVIKGIEDHYKGNKKWDSPSYRNKMSLADDFAEKLENFDRNTVLKLLKEYDSDYDWKRKFEGRDAAKTITESYKDLDLNSIETILKDRKYPKEAKLELLDKMGSDTRFGNMMNLKPMQALKMVADYKNFEEALSKANDYDSIREFRDNFTDYRNRGKQDALNKKLYNIIENTPINELDSKDVINYIENNKDKSLANLYDTFGDKFVKEIYDYVDSDKLAEALISGRNFGNNEIVDAFKEFMPERADEFQELVDAEKDEYKSPMHIIEDWLNYDKFKEFQDYRTARQETKDYENLEKLKKYFANRNRASLVDIDDDYFEISDEDMKE